jgi:hypothetical protein
MQTRKTTLLLAVALVGAAVLLLLVLRGSPDDIPQETEISPQSAVRQERLSPREAKGGVSVAGTPKKTPRPSRDLSSKDPRELSVSAASAQATRPPTDAKTALKRWEDLLAIYTAEEALERVKTTPVTATEQAEVRECFTSLDPDDKLENIHHAINLLPDETFPVLYGILFDMSQPVEIITELFHDLLNRDDALKYPVMEEIVKDKSHPMYVESARILDIVKDDD